MEAILKTQPKEQGRLESFVGPSGAADPEIKQQWMQGNFGTPFPQTWSDEARKRKAS